MAIDKKVNTRFTAKDGITRRFGVMARASARFGKKAVAAFRGVNRQAGKFRGITSGFLKAQVIGKGFGLLTRGIGAVTTGFIAFDKAALGATVRFKDIGPTASNFKDKLKEIEAVARQVGAETEFTAAQAAEGLNKLAVSGFSSAEAMGALKGIIDVSTATGEDFARVADIQSDLLGAFGLSIDHTAEKFKNMTVESAKAAAAVEKIENMNRLNDVMVKTANSANVTLETMFETMKQIGPIATGVLGASLEEVSALTGVLGNSGIKGSEAMTALKNAYLNLASPASAARKTLRRFNVTMKDGQGGVRKITDVIDELGQKIKGLDPTKQAAIMDQIFGKRAIAGAKNIMDNVASVKELEKALLAAGFTAQQTADIMRTSIEAKLLAMGSAATEAGFKILNAFRGDGKQGIDAMTEAIRDFDMGPVVESLKITVDLVGKLLSLMDALLLPFKLVGKLIAFVAFKLAQLNDMTGILSFVFNGLNNIGNALIAILSGDLVGAGRALTAGDGGGEEQTPNQGEAQAKAQQATFKGQLDISGAPEGSRLTTSGSGEGFGGFNVELLGAN